jgi:hypothetical protein
MLWRVFYNGTMGEIMTGLEKIKERVRKLLALSKSDNENEALAALEKANRLMEAYGLTAPDIQFESVSVPSTKTYVPWRVILANAVSWLYGCYVYRNSDRGSMIFTGESLDAFMAAEMFEYLVKSIERIARKSIRKNAKYVFRTSFKYGVACRLYNKIMKLGQLCSWLPLRNAKIEAVTGFVEKSVDIVESKKKQRLNTTAFAKGCNAA